VERVKALLRLLHLLLAQGHLVIIILELERIVGAHVVEREFGR
jgi:hypothetical protein